MTHHGETADRFGVQLEILAERLEQAGRSVENVARAGEELDRVSGRTSRNLSRLSSGLSRELSDAFSSLVFDAASASDALRNVGRHLVETTFRKAVSPLADALVGVVSGGLSSAIGGAVKNASGNMFSGGRVAAFAKGGVVDGPTSFPMRNGIGLMGEAGPEAILPLRRSASGRLGVEMSGGASPVHVTMHIHTPDVAGFARSKSQIAAGLERAVLRARRNR